MTDIDKANDDQFKLWNGTAGRAWVEAQQALDLMFAPFEELLVQATATAGARSVLDVGCGTGATTLALARRLGPAARCVGVDVSAPMIELARERARQQGSPATFVQADAQRHPFEARCFDAITSRFGVMFFDDPGRAFGNLRRAAADGAHLRFAAWRGAAENAFMTTAERAAAGLLVDLPARRPDAPGQFAFADRQRIAAVLQAGGWERIEVRPIDVVCSFPERELIRYISWMGPVGQRLQRTDATTREQVIATVRDAFDPYVTGSQVRFTAACWLVDARAADA